MSFQILETSNNNWDNLEFSIDSNLVPDDQSFTIAVSDTINNNSGAANIDVVITFNSIDINESSHFLNVFVEEETVPNSWTPIAESFGRRINSSTGINTVKFVIQSGFAGDTGQPFDINGGVRYNSNENPSGDLRIRVEAIKFNNGNPFIATVNLTGAFRLY